MRTVSEGRIRHGLWPVKIDPKRIRDAPVVQIVEYLGQLNHIAPFEGNVFVVEVLSDQSSRIR
jgi:hypothetical protein